MTNEGCRRIATADGAMLADPHWLGNSQGTPTTLFDPGHWRERGALQPAAQGRGSAWFIASGPDQWVLKCYRRGGLVARIIADRYVWAGEARVRAFAEWRLLQHLVGLGLRVPQPLAARYRRSGLLYRCELITRRIADCRPLSAALAAAPVPAPLWRAIGATVAHMHRLSVDHADLNAHNILLDDAGAVSLIDFDRGRLRADGGWKAGNLARLLRSLEKISADLPAGRFSPAMWSELLAGYRPA